MKKNSDNQRSEKKTDDNFEIDWKTCDAVLSGFAAVTMNLRDEKATEAWVNTKFVK